MSSKRLSRASRHVPMRSQAAIERLIEIGLTELAVMRIASPSKILALMKIFWPSTPDSSSHDYTI
jgi:hypothetical protein